MNNKAQLGMVRVMMGIMLFIVIVITIPVIKDQIIQARSVTDLDCGNTSITTTEKATCIIVDWTLPYYVGIGIAVAIGGGAYGLMRLSKKKE